MRLGGVGGVGYPPTTSMADVWRIFPGRCWPMEVLDPYQHIRLGLARSERFLHVVKIGPVTIQVDEVL